MTDPFRCSVASWDDGEPIAGTAPSDRAWLLVEYAGPWGRKALAESRLPEPVRSRLGSLDGVHVQLIRRHGGRASTGVRIFAAWLGEELWVETTVLERADELAELDLGGLADGTRPGWTAYRDLLWLVCTNGRRDLCCAELGRPIAAALGERWPEQTWETTHLGGHRFAGTLLALPSGLCLGRLDGPTAVEACAGVEAGRVPLDHYRGRAGLAPAAQVAEQAILHAAGVAGAGAVRIDAVEQTGDRHVVHGRLTAGRSRGADDPGAARVESGAPGGDARGERDRTWRVEVRTTPGAPRRQSCGDDKVKAAPVLEVAVVDLGPQE